MIPCTALLHRLRNDFDSVSERELDTLLLYYQSGAFRQGCSVDALIFAMVKHPIRFHWPEQVQRWDLASTGSVANITPIFRYLWLMVKAHASGTIRRVVPKISLTWCELRHGRYPGERRA